jgi:MFS family permease
MATLPATMSPAFEWRRTTSAQRRTVIAAALGWMLDAFDIMLYSLVVAELIRHFGITKSTAGFLNSITLVASAIGSVLFGLAADRWGRRSMLCASILAYSVFTFACGLATSIPMLAAFRFLLGMGMGGEWNTGAALVAETWPSDWRGRAMAWVQSSWAIGYALAAAAAGLILSRAGWRAVFFVGIVPALVTLWIRRGVPEPELWKKHAQRPRTGGGDKAMWRAALGPMLALLATNTFGMFAWWGLFSWLPAYLSLPVAQGGRGFQLTGTTSFLVILNLAGMFPGYLLFGALADRFGRKPSVIGYLAAAALMAVLFAGARQPLLILLSACLAAFFGTGFFVGCGIIAAEVFPTAIRSAALGVTYNVARGLSALAPLMIGRIGETRGLDAAFYACGAAYAAAAVTAILVRETRGTELA